MRRTAITVLTLAAALACGACGSSGGSDGSNAASASSAVSSPEAAPSSAQTAAQQCSSQTWPQKLPDFHGKALGEMVVGAGLCYNITAITAPDGTDVMHDATALELAAVLAERIRADPAGRPLPARRRRPD